ncbi:YkyB family protein [Aureibacillus halotolerans]|uniref:YkyB-like protein n=1 Tax=Aureibacillus halotolerans TaxID=1508390 RepID=A0A4R6U8V2_9BACI|nr:YkyB family protein [Aureibacillus halotolerans]TDQ42236.1 YkyB-like protein [Aureibacillus halotolerans]
MQKSEQANWSISTIAQAIFVINKHAKTATNPRDLYSLKHKAIRKLIEKKEAKKIGMHFTKNPKKSQQHSDLLIRVGDYYFHVPPSKSDFAEVPHLGTVSESYRNPKTSMTLTKAKNVLQDYTGWRQTSDEKHSGHKQRQAPVFKRLGESYPWKP